MDKKLIKDIGINTLSACSALVLYYAISRKKLVLFNDTLFIVIPMALAPVVDRFMRKRKKKQFSGAGEGEDRYE